MDVLQEIYQHKLVEVRNRKKNLSTQELCAQIDCNNQPKNFAKALKSAPKNAIIAEIKKASPSGGLIRPDFDPVALAKSYENAGAACISVLTDEKYFQGHDNYLKQVRQATNLPILRKDFIIDEYQITEAKMLGADCILLIVAMLDDETLRRLEKYAIDADLSVLIEVHDENELRRALKMQSPLIGINNRNLKTLKTDINNGLSLANKVPDDKILVIESGISSKSAIEKFNQIGIKNFLIGEHFMRQNDVGTALKVFL